jgi:hypothetical protein
LVPDRFSNSSNAASKSDLSSGEGVIDMTLEEMVIVEVVHQILVAAQKWGTNARVLLMDDRRAHWRVKGALSEENR